jgi:hypothetical protein
LPSRTTGNVKATASAAIAPRLATGKRARAETWAKGGGAPGAGKATKGKRGDATENALRENERSDEPTGKEPRLERGVSETESDRGVWKEPSDRLAERVRLAARETETCELAARDESEETPGSRRGRITSGCYEPSWS